MADQLRLERDTKIYIKNIGANSYVRKPSAREERQLKMKRKMQSATYRRQRYAEPAGASTTIASTREDNPILGRQL